MFKALIILILLLSCGKESINKNYITENNVDTSILSCSGYIKRNGEITPFLNNIKYAFTLTRVEIDKLIIFSGCIKTKTKSYCNTIETYDDYYDWLRIPIGLTSYDYAMTVNDSVLKITIYNKVETIFIEANPSDYCKFN